MTKTEALEKIEELKKFIEQEEDGAWKPEIDDEYWYVSSSGNISQEIWDDVEFDNRCLEMGNVFKTEEEAQAHKMRLMSMAKRGKMPEEGDAHWYWSIGANKALSDCWNFHSVDYAYYWIGNIHKTKEAAEKWGKEFAHFFK